MLKAHVRGPHSEQEEEEEEEENNKTMLH